MRSMIGMVLLTAVVLAAQDKREAPVDTAALAGFLVKAKYEGYASGDQSRIRKLGDDGLEATFAEGQFSYRDRWYGETAFSGEEIVHCQGKPVWSMNFYGATSKGVQIPVEFPKFHKSALRRVTAASPFRGPQFYQEGELVYVNDVTGSIQEFSGVERVLFRGREIFRLVYHGGLLQ
jgi:hypothetical protein